jgi:Nnf1
MPELGNKRANIPCKSINPTLPKRKVGLLRSFCWGPNRQSPVLLPPESLIRAYTLPLKRAELAHLESQLSHINASNDGLLQEVDAQRTEIEGLNKAMRSGVEDLGGAVGSCSGIPVGEMRDSMEDIIPTLRV